MFPSEFQLQQRRHDMQKEAEHHSLVKLATDGAPNFWQRIVARLSVPQVQIAAPSVCIAVKKPTEALA